MAFKYHNMHPDGFHLPDCVIRAISLALNIPYYETTRLLENNGIYFNCDMLNKECYEKLLDFDFNIPHYTSYGKTVQEVADDFPNNILLLRMDGHISVSLFSVIHDIWDCSSKIVTDFWIVE